MEKLRSLGTDVIDTVAPTYEIYGSLLADNASAIHKTKKETFSYGPSDRMKLDLYTPSETSDKPFPVLIFLYGGGFVTGDKVLAAISGNLVYTNVGYYFAENFGFTTIIMDYRLVSHGAKYPSGAEDLDLVLQWVEKQLHETEKIFLLGNSAGGYHVSSWLFGAQFVEHRSKLCIGTQTPQVSAACIIGSSFRFCAGKALSPALEIYTGAKGSEVDNLEPICLMMQATQGLPPNEVARLPPCRIMFSELDPEEMKQSSLEFFDLWTRKGGRGCVVTIEGHNHISTLLALGTGIAKEERWATKLGDWLSAI
ncbi:hypothetical protein RBB50_002222 [Rhinocladiella similis]